jgi:hypothetical protein
VYDAMRIDPAWSVWEDRSFTWWGHRQAQRVSADAGYDDEGFVIYRLDAQADVPRDLEVTDEVLGKVNALEHDVRHQGLGRRSRQRVCRVRGEHVGARGHARLGVKGLPDGRRDSSRTRQLAGGAARKLAELERFMSELGSNNPSE